MCWLYLFSCSLSMYVCMCIYIVCMLLRPNHSRISHFTPDTSLVSQQHTPHICVILNFHIFILEFLISSCNLSRTHYPCSYCPPPCIIRPPIELNKQLSNCRFWYILVSKEYYMFLPLKHFSKPFSLLPVFLDIIQVLFTSHLDYSSMFITGICPSFYSVSLQICVPYGCQNNLHENINTAFSG